MFSINIFLNEYSKNEVDAGDAESGLLSLLVLSIAVVVVALAGCW